MQTFRFIMLSRSSWVFVKSLRICSCTCSLKWSASWPEVLNFCTCRTTARLLQQSVNTSFKTINNPTFGNDWNFIGTFFVITEKRQGLDYSYFYAAEIHTGQSQRNDRERKKKNNFLTRITARKKIWVQAQLIASRADVHVCVYVLVGQLTNTCRFGKKSVIEDGTIHTHNIELSVIL